MKTVLRFIVITLSIAALTRTIASAEEPALSSSRAVVVFQDKTLTPGKSAQQNTAAVTPVSTPPATPTPEIIPKSYVTVTPEVKGKTLASIVMGSLTVMLRPVSSKIYSLLNWKSENRAKDLEVASYNRVGQFGKWAQDRKDSTCYNTRAKVLIRDSATPVVFAADNACSVDKGQWNDPYGGKVLTDAKAEIQIDHMVPLKNAYVSGAYKWDNKSRCLYANYLGENFHLISVDGVENQRKGDKAPDQYMPSNKAYVCTYIKNWLTVKTLWGLDMTPNEADAIKKLILSEGCKTEDFVLSEAEIQEQRKFVSENANLCVYEKPAALQVETAAIQK